MGGIVMKRSIRITALLIAALFALLSLSSCGSSADKASEALDVGEYYNSKSSYGYESDMMAYDDYSYAEETEAETSVSEPKPDEKVDFISDPSDRKLVRNAELIVQTKTFDEFIKSTETKVSSLGGYVESSDVSSNGYYSDGNRQASLTARVPADKFDEFLDSVSEIAAVTSKSISVNDITSNYIDTESRIKALKAEQTALLGILEKAKNVSETIEVYSRLSEVNASLERYESQLKTYDKQVAYSTIRMNIYEVERVSTANEKEGFFKEIGRRLSDNLYNLGTGLRNLAVWFISSLPYLLIFAGCIAVVIVVIRKIHKKRKAKREAKRNESESAN